MNNPDNLLGDETSPYLLQHADNPVNWHPWNQQALDLAKRENKPILLSIGYSACHWCHVMAHESFEDATTARIMNRYFINIKVDREERPDLDKIYQIAHSLLTSRPGGWPLTVFLSPHNQMPFFAGTYFPDKPRHNMPSFQDLLHHIHQYYETRQDDIKQQDASLQTMLQQINTAPVDHATPITALPLDIARRQIESAFDEQYGGFSQAPKFPHPTILERLLQHGMLMKLNQQDDSRALYMADFSLQKMAQGGLFDHIGGGFYRYSTDQYWMIPHFEKMLYDNGPLLALYSHAYQITHNALFKGAAMLTAHWVMDEMQSTDGGYYSALDADSENTEGKFYVWDAAEVQSILGKDYTLFSYCFALDQAANFEDQWHLHMHFNLADIASKFKLSEDALLKKTNDCRLCLLKHRAQRIRPALDDKILTSWNALMIRGMIISGQVFQQNSHITSAKKALDFIQQNLWKDQKLRASYKQGKAHLNAYLDDYAYLLQALLCYLQYEWHNHYYQWALHIADIMLDFFEDKKAGGFFFTSHDHEKLIQRSKVFADDAMPSGNGVAAQSLQILGLLSGETRYLEAAENTLKAAQKPMQDHAISHCGLLQAQQTFLNPPSLVILRGTKDKMRRWQDFILQYYAPNIYCFALPENIALDKNLSLKKSRGDICAYICTGMNCSAEITEQNKFEQTIKALAPHNEHHQQ